MRRVLSFILCYVFILTSCATVNPKYQITDLSRIDHKDNAVFFGKLNVYYKDKLDNQNCFLSFSQGENKFDTKLNDDGSFTGVTKPGKVNLERVVCHSKTYSFSNKKYQFENKAGPKYNYIGEMEMKWNPGEFNPIVTILGALVGWIAISNSRTKISFVNKSLTERKPASVAYKKYRKSYLNIPFYQEVF